MSDFDARDDGSLPFAGRALEALLDPQHPGSVLLHAGTSASLIPLLSVTGCRCRRWSSAPQPGLAPAHTPVSLLDRFLVAGCGPQLYRCSRRSPPERQIFAPKPTPSKLAPADRGDRTPEFRLLSGESDREEASKTNPVPDRDRPLRKAEPLSTAGRRLFYDLPVGLEKPRTARGIASSDLKLLSERASESLTFLSASSRPRASRRGGAW